MNKSYITINGIPAILWGAPSPRLFIAVHGNMSHKEDTVISMLAEEGEHKGFGVLSFDLPEHGGRKAEPTLCKVQTCVQELRLIMDYAKSLGSEISLFACSMGAYFSLLAYHDCPLAQALFLSPVADMQMLIENMMLWFNVTEERLKAEQEISTPIGQTLYWDYYRYVKEHPVSAWPAKTSILYGENDELCDYKTVSGFAKRFNSNMQILKGGEHFFHTEEQLDAYAQWLRKEIA